MSIRKIKQTAKVWTERDWKRFARSIGAKVTKIEGDNAACLEWPNREFLNDDAWFSVNMAERIIKATGIK